MVDPTRPRANRTQERRGRARDPPRPVHALAFQRRRGGMTVLAGVGNSAVTSNRRSKSIEERRKPLAVPAYEYPRVAPSRIERSHGYLHVISCARQINVSSPAGFGLPGQRLDLNRSPV